MSLPQKASLLSNATRTYSLAVQDILTLQTQPANEARVQSVRVRLPYLRRLVTCCACAGILDDAMVSACDHHYCFDCQFKEPVLPIHCRQCRDRIGLQPALQLRTLVLCYHNLCHLLDTFYPPGVATGTLVVGTDDRDDTSPRPADRRDPILELLREAHSTVYKCPPSIFRVKVPKESSLPTSLVCCPPASLAGSLVSKGEQPVVGSTASDMQATSGSPLVGLEVKQALTCNSSSPPGGASIPSNQRNLVVGGKASGEQQTDQGLGVGGEACGVQQTDQGLGVGGEASGEQRTDQGLGVGGKASGEQRTDQGLGVGGEASQERGTDQCMKEYSVQKPDLPSGASLSTSTSVTSTNNQCAERQPPAMSVKRRKVNRSWK